MEENLKFKAVTNLLKNEIIERYGNLHKFAAHAGMNYQTINSIFRRGIKHAAFNSISTICEKLDIDMESLVNDLKIVRIKDTRNYKNSVILEKLEKLDTKQLDMLVAYLDLLISAREDD